mmetsp:Transcript_12363/g.40683  ORF Transcript_12363/g.40683 Transcript_12363/m.40683 type:complete len:376 (-) Transcript_12363:133-1260(-)
MRVMAALACTAVCAFVWRRRSRARPCAAVATASGAARSKTVDFVAASPLYADVVRLPEAAQALTNHDALDATAHAMYRALALDRDNLSASERSRVLQYYTPVLCWVRALVQRHRAQWTGRGAPPPPLVIGLSAPQGCGKTTLVEILEQLLREEGTAAAAVSIDDFYLTGAEQEALAAANPDNDLVQVRGNCGTHDLTLGRETLQALQELGAGASMRVPRYDKSMRMGRGDRAPREKWPTVEGPLQVVLFEGWMLGFSALPSAAEAAAVDRGLELVNERLPEYERQWYSRVDAWVVLEIDDPKWVHRWRAEAEQRMRESGRSAMSDAQVADFVARYLPAYEAYLPALYSPKGPSGAEGKPLLRIRVDQNRAVVQRK